MTSYLPIALLAENESSRVELALSISDGTSKAVALKRILPGGTPSERAERERTLLAEAVIAGRLRHPNIVGLLEIGQFRGEMVVALEYVEGATLEQLIAHAAHRGARLPESVILRIMSDVLDGLQHAHKAFAPGVRRWPILHRDISPANILIGLDGRARLFDFRAAKRVVPVEMVFCLLDGSVPHLAPEQISGRPADTRSDVFACGAVLHEALGGEDAASEPVLGSLLARCLAEEPEKRFPTAHALQRAVWACGQMRLGLATATRVAGFVDDARGAVICARRRMLAAALGGHEGAPASAPPQSKSRPRGAPALAFAAIFNALF